MTETRDDVTTRAASYAAGALTAAERREVEADLRRSPRLAAEVREFGETAAMLGLATEQVAPPTSLRDSILGAVNELPQTSNIVRGPWFARPAAALIGAAAAVVLVVGGGVAALTFSPHEASGVDRIVAAADSERASADVDGGGTVTLVWSDSLERAAILVSHLSSLPSDRTYQMWFINSQGEAASAGTFAASGSDVQSIVLAGNLARGDSVGITVEPSGGSAAPSTTPIVVIPTEA
ncbi:MAG: anti-sigma factor [Pseudolysinimonas sp.]|uniref:anti-sigma factor n=1 Tax=Pseudolysinimonas sp. TaxID=2680009 RepID=UPI003267193F